MRTSIVAIIASFAFAMTATTAQAVERTTIEDWSGFYLGSQGNYVRAKSNHFIFELMDMDIDKSRLNGAGKTGIHAGYSLQSNSIVWGFETDAEGPSDEGSFKSLNSSVMSERKWQGSLRGRIGWSMGQWQPYVTGGLAVGGFDFSGKAALANQSAKSSTVRIGGTAGAGLEYGITDKISAGIEYRYTDYVKSTAVAPNTSASVSGNAGSHAIAGRLSFRF